MWENARRALEVGLASGALGFGVLSLSAISMFCSPGLQAGLWFFWLFSAAVVGCSVSAVALWVRRHGRRKGDPAPLELAVGFAVTGFSISGIVFLLISWASLFTC